jgi:hypothetical protein
MIQCGPADGRWAAVMDGAGGRSIDREARSCLLAQVRWATSLGFVCWECRRSKADHGEGENRKLPGVRVQRPTGNQNHYRRGRSRFAVVGFVMQEWKVRKARGRRSEIGRAVAKRDTSHERWMEAGRSIPLEGGTSSGARQLLAATSTSSGHSTRQAALRLNRCAR